MKRKIHLSVMFIVLLGLLEVGTATLVRHQLSFLMFIMGIFLLSLLVILVHSILLPIGNLIQATIHQFMYAVTPATPEFDLKDLDSDSDLGDAHLSSPTSKEGLGPVLDNMADPMILLDQDRRIRMMNSAAVGLTGFTTGDLVGRPMETLWAPSNSLDLSKITERSLPYKVILMNTKTGDVVRVLVSGMTYKDEYRRRAGFVLVAKEAPAENSLKQESSALNSRVR